MRAIGVTPGRRGGSRARRVAVLFFLVRVLLVVIAAVLGVATWFGSESAIHPRVMSYAWPAGVYPDLRPEPIVLTSRTGARIVGRFFRGRAGATVILSHGYGGNQNDMLPWADVFQRAGFNVFTYDMRAHGRSGGDAVTFGALEQDDLVSVVDYLASRRDVDRARIGALGVSLGGAVTVLAAARDRRIRAVVDDCGYSDVRNVIDSSFRHFIGLPAFPFSPLTVLLSEWRTGVNVDTIRPVDRIALISPRPVFLIHGLDDTIIAPANSRRDDAAAREPKSLWLVPGAGHAASRAVAGAEYDRRVVAFFRRYLGAS